MLRSFGVLEEVSSTSAAGTAEHVPGTEYVTGTLILRSFGVLEEVSSIGTAGTAEYVPGTWYLVRSDN